MPLVCKCFQICLLLLIFRGAIASPIHHVTSANCSAQWSLQMQLSGRRSVWRGIALLSSQDLSLIILHLCNQLLLLGAFTQKTARHTSYGRQQTFSIVRLGDAQTTWGNLQKGRIAAGAPGTVDLMTIRAFHSKILGTAVGFRIKEGARFSKVSCDSRATKNLIVSLHWIIGHACFHIWN